jgi:hypothetical protein
LIRLVFELVKLKNFIILFLIADITLCIVDKPKRDNKAEIERPRDGRNQKETRQ